MYSTHDPESPFRRPVPNEVRPSAALAGLTRTDRAAEFDQVTRGFWVPSALADDLRHRSLAIAAAYPDAVLCGWSAVALHGATPPEGALPEISVGRPMRRRHGIRVRRHEIPDEAVCEVSGARVTTPRWTAFDLSRFLPFREAVIAVESLDGVILRLADMPPMLDAVAGRWGAARTRRVFAAADARSESPMETVLRLDLHDAGFVSFVPQVEVPHLRYRLDLADAARKIAVEYDGAHHRDPVQHAADERRRNRLRAEGWTVIVVTGTLLRDHRAELLAQVAKAFAAADRTRAS